ncbi:MAG: SprB repeat-containing protein, partial [Saprospiraceae bacterium]|nr:SprB repeat-containing protein [Saprospiraceae bacterium]
MTGTTAKLTAFFDWNDDGDFDDLAEMIPVNVPNGTNGVVNMTVPVPANAVLNNDIGVRFRISTDALSSMSPSGSAPDGEVEDYIAQVMAFDFGDLPDNDLPGSYPTTQTDGGEGVGASHKLVDGLKLGASVDFEGDGQPNATATGDGADENGIAAFPGFVAGQPAVVTVNVMNMTTEAAIIYGYFDWNKDGDFDDPDEKTSVAVPVGFSGNVPLNVTVPVNAVPNMNLGARFRLSTDDIAAATAEGPAPDGEVEDYLIQVSCPTLTPGTVVTNATCYNGANGSIQVSVPAIGIAPFNFIWDGPGANDGAANNVSSPYTLSNLPAGSYSITVSDANGCTGTATVSVGQPGSPVSLSVLSKDVTCNGANDGSINLVVAGGTYPYTYDWSNDGPDSPDDDTEDLSNLSPGAYTVTVTDANGCVSTTTATITEPAPMSASVSVVNVTCTGGDDGSIALTASGGILPYTYDWSNDGPETPDDDAADLTNIPAGNYTVTITDANGCSFSTTTAVTEPLNGMSLSISVTNATCGLSNGALDLTVSGGTPGFSYDWSNDGPDDPDNDTQDLANVPAGLYFITVTDANGCTSSTFAVVGNTDGPQVTAVGTDPLCNGGTDGSID